MQVQSKKDYYVPFFETTKKIALQPQKIEVMKGVEEFRFMRSLGNEVYFFDICLVEVGNFYNATRHLYWYFLITFLIVQERGWVI